MTGLSDVGLTTDPLRVARVSDDVPIALFPLRLETRFLTETRDTGSRRTLCVRVFPDDVLIDSFQPQIGRSELDNVTLYWTHRWRAGGNPTGHRAAWAQLVRSTGSGRAKWLTEQVAPLNSQDEPAVAAGEHLLVVRPPTPLPPAERTALATFWKRVWSTSGLERDAAFADLVAAVGGARAADMESSLEPVNLRDVAVKPSAAITPVVAFLDLPDPATLSITADAWTRGARAWLLPERLVLLGFRNQQQVLFRLGEPIPAELLVGPDPSASDADQIRADGADLRLPDTLRWTIDFDDAVSKGMGFRVDLTQLGLEPTFDRLFVLGVRVGGDGAAELSELIAHHQASRKGFCLLPQGRATNNSEAATAGYSWWEDPNESFRHYFETDPTDDPTTWQQRKDGAWLAGLLGVSRALLQRSPNYYGTDQAEARAMNVALWPATLGYYMEQMLEPVFAEATVRETRDFFNRFVIGRGTVPLVRVGRQPYGILPATAWSKMSWWSDERYARLASALDLPRPAFLSALQQLSLRAETQWRTLAQQVSHVGAPGPDPQQTLLDIVGLHPTSAEFYQRLSQSFMQYYNALGFATEPLSGPATAAARRHVEAGLQALSELGWNPAPDTPLPRLVELIFLRQPNLLKGPLVDMEASDRRGLRVTRADGRNYVDWLQSAARASHDALRKQEGFADDVPTALLYLLLHHALDLGYIDADLELRRTALAMSDAAYANERREPTFIHVAQAGSASRWESLYRAQPAVTGNPTLHMGEFIPTVLTSRDPYLNTQLAACDLLKGATTGALERALVEHLDCLTYRLDAWRLGMQAVQLSALRGESVEGFATGGVRVGAYGWLEHVHPKAATLTPVSLDPELAAIFATPTDPPLRADSSNFGFLHAPSLDHAVTAAMLRNGHLANATSAAPDLLAVDLSSERVRWALQIIEGVRNGQSFGALLGYRLERALHDEPTVFLDAVIYELRRAFPLAGNRNLLTKTDDLDTGDITKVEARNVVDGALFLDHLATPGQATYPYGVSGLPALSDLVQPGSPGAAAIGAIVDRCVADMRQVADAVADLAVSEGVYQLVRGNYDRAAGALDAVSKGTHAQIPEVATTPRNGTTLTHRVALHLEGGLLPSSPANTTPRARGEPALAKWLNDQLPDPATVFATVNWRSEASGGGGSLTPSMADLGLARVDLFYMMEAGGDRDLPGFDDLLIDFAEQHGAPSPRHDALFSLEYKPDGVAGLTLFEVAPLVRALRGLIFGARAVRPTDFALQNAATASADAAIVIRGDKAQAVLGDLQATRLTVATFIATLEAAVGVGVDPDSARDAARDHIDDWIGAYASAVRPVARFGLQAASLTTAVEGRRPRFTAMLGAIDALIARWQQKQIDYDDIIDTFNALPFTATDEERTTLLIRAGRVVSTTVIAPLPPTVGDLENAVGLLRDDLDTALAQLITLHDDATTVGATLSAISSALTTIAAVDQTPFDVAPFRDSALALAVDLLQRASQLRDDIDRRVTEASEALARAAAASGDKAQDATAEAAHAILGEAFIVLPEFTLSADQLAEWDAVWSDRADLLTHLTTGPEATPFPVDDWLHGVARVRERLGHLERVVLLGDALETAAPPALEALQFPDRPDDAWLGLRFPATFPDGTPFAVLEDRLLYSAIVASGAEIDASQPDTTYSGFLLDEWIEMIPAEHATTGLSFHFDRPNTEAPQAILLATPPVRRGAWQWQDLVDALHETLDMARRRAVEPAQLDQTSLAPLLPALLSSITTHPITTSLNLGVNNNVHLALAEGPP